MPAAQFAVISQFRRVHRAGLSLLRASYGRRDIAQTFPNLRILLAHAAYPYVLKTCHVAMNHEHIYLGTDMYAFNIPGGDMYIKAANSLIGDKIVFGSAYPIFNIEAAKNYYLNCGLREDILPQVMAGNAAKFLGIE